MENDVIKHTAIIYTDGSAQPNPGPYGGAAHGYIYVTGEFEKNNDNPTKITVTDKGYIRNEDIIESVNKVKPVHYIDALYSYVGEGTNNIGEVLAVIEVLNNLISMETISLDKVGIYTDSMYVINIFNNISNGEDWVNDVEKPNYNLWVMFNETLKLYNELNIKISIIKVKAHFEDFGNNLVDRLALIARLRSTNNIGKIDFIVSPGNKYWKPKIERHPFLRYNELFFNGTMDNINEPNTYTVMKYPTDVELGKRNNNVSYGVMMFKDNPEYIPDIKNIFNKYVGTTKVLSSVNLKNIYSVLFNRYYKMFGDDVLLFNKRNKYLEILGMDPVAAQINPPGLANKALTYTIQLRDYLEYYFKNDELPEYRVFKDVTEYLYKDNKFLLGNIKTLEFNIMDVFGRDIKLIPQLGLDLPDRNQLKSLEKYSPKVTVMFIKDSRRVLKYYFIVELQKTGDVGIWTSMFSNTIILKEK